MKPRKGHPLFYKLLKKMETIHDMKNSDYSEANDALSNFKISERFGIPAHVGVLVRISDKFSRVSQLIKKGENNNSVKDEKIEDTLLDMANYCLLMIILYKERMFKK